MTERRCPICGKPQPLTQRTVQYEYDYEGGQQTLEIIYYQSHSTEPHCFGHKEITPVPQVFHDAFEMGDLQL